jgi:WD40 repeat protein
VVNRTLYFATKSSVFWNYIASSSSDNTIQVWDATTGAHITIYRGHSAPVNTVMWSPDDKRIVTAFSSLVQVSQAS